MGTETILERRLRNEWLLLQNLSLCNPGRISDLEVTDGAIELCLHGPAASIVVPTGYPCPISVHAVRIDFPVHFPAVPMELFLATPVIHPNVHPETGFVCLWDRHRVSNTVEHAMHKLVRMLAGQLQNTSPMHVMQPDALSHLPCGEPMPLLGVEYGSDQVQGSDAADSGRRRRLQ